MVDLAAGKARYFILKLFIMLNQPNLVDYSNGQLVTNSLLVAEKFDKQHRHVIDSIRKLLTSAENSAVLSMFLESTYLDGQNREQPMYIMNRDGFSLLVMGFTGKDALNFKLEFIEAFNVMERKIKEELKPLSQGEIIGYLAEALLQHSKEFIETEKSALTPIGNEERPAVYPQEIREKAMQMYCNDFMSVPAIAKKLGCNMKTVYAWRDQYYWKRNSKADQSSKDLVFSAQQLHSILNDVALIEDRKLRSSIRLKLMGGR